MGSYKAPGPDGYQAIFFKNSRHIIGRGVHSFVRGAMKGEQIPASAKEAIFVLILKEAHPTSIKGFRPLSLCNVTVKLPSKIIANKLKGALKSLIAPSQTCFVPGRQGIENAIPCQEIVHSFRYTKPKKGSVIIKVDLGKAYDRLEWSFIRSSLDDAGFPPNLSDVIMHLVSDGSCRHFLNGDLTYEIKPTRGLRQGDLLSPYLFELCVERLGHWIGKKVEEGKIKPVRASRSGPGVSYLFFADDLLLMSEPDEDQLVCLK